MKKKKKWIIGIGCSSFLLFSLFFLLFFLNDFLCDKENTQKEMKKIQEQYVSFKESITSYNDARDKIYDTVFKESYFDTMEEKDALNKATLKEAEQVVKQVSKTSSSLKKACDGVIYPVSSVNIKCSSFSLAYEQVVNSYVSDVEQYNLQLEKYNEWAKSNQKNPLSLISTSLKYVDYNKDKIYSGKEIENESSK